MRNSLYLVILLYGCTLLILGCGVTTDDDEQQFNCLVENKSDHLLTIAYAVLPQGLLYDSITLAPGQEESIGRYFSTGWAGFGCQQKTLLFRFNDNRGYYCYTDSIGFINDSPKCFQNMDPFVHPVPSFDDADYLNIRITVTQEDYENAFEL